MKMQLWPDDEHNRVLLQNVRPHGWVNPNPINRYNLVVIGAGPAGLVTSAIAAGIGARVALIEKHLMGGDCLNVGCVPSKGMIQAARGWAELGRVPSLGVRLPEGVIYDFPVAMARMRKLRARISALDSAHRFQGLGVDVYLGEGRFTGQETVEVEGKTLRFTNAAICTGARAAEPAIPGLQEAGYLTNETVFNLVDRPRRLAVFGAGAIGCEFGQAFARFGSRVTVFEQERRVLPREDVDAASVVEQSMRRDGVAFVCDCRVNQIKGTEGGKVVQYVCGGHSHELEVDEILVGAGRAPNVEGLNLESVGVSFDSRRGIHVDPFLRTTNPRIFAAGDVCSAYKFTHAADAMAQIVIQNALFPHPLGLGYARADSLIIPWCTYTEPELAHVGLSETDARAKGLEIETYTFELRDVDRAILDGQDEGFARVHVKKGTDKILGATLVATRAGDMINEFSVLMNAGLGLKVIAKTIHPYPTQAEVVKKVANAWRKAQFTSRQKEWLSKWFAWRR